MDERNRFTGDHSFSNGSTQPPKNHRGLLALVLGLSIFVCGIISAAGISRLFRLPGSNDLNAVSFSPFDATETSENPYHSTGDATAPTGNATLQLTPTPDAVQNVPQEGGLGLQEIYAQNIPSVVSITCTLSSGNAGGTGVILSKDGYVVTNAHVVEDAQRIQILLTDGRTFDAQLVGADSVSDLAVLYIAANDLTPAVFGDSRQMKVGDAVAAIGDPLGIELRGTMTDGIISAINRDLVLSGRTVTLIQTNAALNSGNSGGPLINCYGQVIGINTMKIGAFSDAAGVEGLGFAIPSVTVKEIVDQLICQGYVSGRPALPFEGDWVSLFNQQFRRIPAGFFVKQPPENSGIQAKDILLKIDDVRVTNESELNAIMAKHQVGDSVNLTFYRNGTQFSITVQLTEAGVS